MLRNVTFHEKERRRQTGPTRSRRMRRPALGALGCMRPAGLSRSDDRQAARAAPTVTATPMTVAATAGAASTGSGMGRAGTP